MVLDRLLELKSQFKKDSVKPLIFNYLYKIEELKESSYDNKLKSYMALCDVKNKLLKERGYK